MIKTKVKEEIKRTLVLELDGEGLNLLQAVLNSGKEKIVNEILSTELQEQEREYFSETITMADYILGFNL